MAAPRATSTHVAGGRALVSSVEIVGLAGLGHAAAGGGVPDPGYLLMLAGVMFGASLLTLGGVLRLRTVLPVAAAAQLGLHLAFAHAGHAGTAHAGMSQAAMSQSGTAHAGTAMLAVHLLTAVVTALLLVLQARAAARVLAWLDRLLDRPRWAPGAPPPRLAAARPRQLSRRLLLATAPRRGPPQRHALAAIATS